MLQGKEKSPRLLEQTMGDVTMGSPSIVYPDKNKNVKCTYTILTPKDSEYWEYRADRLIECVEKLKDFLDICPDTYARDRRLIGSIEATISAMEADIEEAKADAAYNREIEAKEAALDEVEREAEYWRDAL